MKRISTLDIKIDGTLKAKRCTIIITSYEASSNAKEKIKGDGQASSHSITFPEADGVDVETGLGEAPKTTVYR